MTWDLERDVVIVGSGAGSMCAALIAKQHGKAPLVVEKQAKVGGSTAMSGGLIWVPGNRFLREPDSFEDARRYLDHVIGDVGRASPPAVRDTYVREARHMLAFLEGLGVKLEHAGFSDYYTDAPGARSDGRSVMCSLFDIGLLGEWATELTRFEAWPPSPLTTLEARTLSLTRTAEGKALAVKLGARIANEKSTGQRLRGMGCSLQAQLLHLALDAEVEIWREAPMTELVVEGGVVTGIVVRRAGAELRVRARHGVLLNAGGFSRNEAMRRQFQSALPGAAWTAANHGDTGEVINAARAIGADIALMDAATWVPASFHPDGTCAGFHVPIDAGKPHCIIVDERGQRFANEAQGYNDFGWVMYRNGAKPVWAILDSRHRNQYVWGSAMPGSTPRAWIDSGYMKRASTIAELAGECGIDSSLLAGAIERFNRFASAGRDEDFGRGDAAQDRVNTGDPTQGPNPCLGEIATAPFYAVRIVLSDVGTQGGLLVDELARVLRPDDTPIEGLYAVGNTTASWAGRSLPGAGTAIGKALTFAYLAARHMVGVTELAREEA